MKDKYDIVIIGGGHAGLEAAWTAAKFDLEILLITMNYDTIGQMSCNPSIGGIAKGNVVRDLDALGGLMPILADRTAIQCRMLNEKKGPAVQALRVQSDKQAYAKLAQELISEVSNITVYQDEVDDFTLEDGICTGVVTNRGISVSCSVCIVASGTFLRGRIHIGNYSGEGGRIGEFASNRLTATLINSRVPLLRFKTGTPARVKKSSIDFSRMTIQEPDLAEGFFSKITKKNGLPHLANLPCHIARTNDETAAVIRQNRDKIPLYSGKINGIGPRYCPSFEDKVFKFVDKTSHIVFVEPEGVSAQTCYLNGISTSLDESLQVDLLRTIPGLEEVEIVKPAYAVEYDVVSPTSLRPTLESTIIGNCFFAGQINGTSGYEEAAGQGFVAGINAACKVKGVSPCILSRSDSYIGVMIDDLVHKGVDEPYRLFTSRAEHRMQLRFDNAYTRLLPIAKQYGLIDSESLSCLSTERETVANVVQKAPSLMVSFAFDGKDQKKPLDMIIKNPDTMNGVTPVLLEKLFEIPFSEDLVTEILMTIRYAGYMQKEGDYALRLERYGGVKIPEGFSFSSINSLSTETIARLSKFAPSTIKEAAILPGIKPTDVIAIVLALRNKN